MAYGRTLMQKVSRETVLVDILWKSVASLIFSAPIIEHPNVNKSGKLLILCVENNYR
jgi:hypothetical protein